MNVLVVEDDGPNRRLVSLLLSSAGADVRAVGSAEDALVEVSRNRPECVIVDLILPRASGLALVDDLTADRSKPGVTIVAVTSLGSTEIEFLARTAGCAEIIRKPIDTETFVNRVAAHLGDRDR